MPEDQEGLERAIVTKFIGALQHAKHRNLVMPQRGDRWPDWETSEGAREIGIEVVEVVNDEHARWRAGQNAYADRVSRLLNDVAPQLTGLSITLLDGDQAPPYPPLRNDAGQRLAREIAEHIRSVLRVLEELNVGQICFHHWQGPPRPTVAAIIRRLAPRESNIPVAVGFSGVFSETIAAARTRLARQIFSKVQRHYQEYRRGALWLLAYQVAGAPAQPEDFAIAKKVLQRRAHPFREIWYLWPLAGEHLGTIERIWP